MYKYPHQVFLKDRSHKKPLAKDSHLARFSGVDAVADHHPTTGFFRAAHALGGRKGGTTKDLHPRDSANNFRTETDEKKGNGAPTPPSFLGLAIARKRNSSRGNRSLVVELLQQPLLRQILRVVNVKHLCVFWGGGGGGCGGCMTTVGKVEVESTERRNAHALALMVRNSGKRRKRGHVRTRSHAHTRAHTP